MRRLITLALLLAAASFAMPAAAQESPRSQFYEFPSLDIDGNRKAPTMSFNDARQKVAFGRLLRLKRSFFNELQATGSDLSLK